MIRAISLLTVADAATLDEMKRILPLDEHIGASRGEGWEVGASFERQIVPLLRERGIPVLIRYARRARTPSSDLSGVASAESLSRLSPRAREVLYIAARHAIEGMVVGIHAWDPIIDAPAVRELLSAGLLLAIDQLDTPPLHGRMALHPDLPAPPPVPYDFLEAVMPEPDDLEAPRVGMLSLLHDLASVAAVIDTLSPKRTIAGTISASDGKRMHERLCSDGVGNIEDHPRWGRAIRALEALGVVSLDLATRRLTLDLGLEQTLAGSTEDALDRIVHRLVDADQHSALPAVRAALRCAGNQSIDEVVFEDLLFEQHREVLFTAWRRGAIPTYPVLHDESPRAFDRAGFEEVELPLLRRLISRLSRLGMLRCAPGVFAGTEDGRRWASAEIPSVTAPPPVWLGSDLEILVPPGGITPWERFQIERLSKPLARDTVDRYRLDRAGVASWLAYHEIEEAIALLSRRSPTVPPSVVSTLTGWAREASRVVVTRGVVIDD